MHVDPHLVRTFVAVTRWASFSAAGDDLGYTQSAVSQQIAALEADLGVILLERRPVRPTPAGLRLLEHAGPLLLRLDAARADVTRPTGAPVARLSIGVTPLSLGEQFTSTLSDLRRRRPQCVVTVSVLGRNAVCADVARRELDVGLVDGLSVVGDPLHLPDVGPVVALAVVEQPLVVVLAAGHPLAGRSGLRLADLADARWIDAPDTTVSLAQLRTVAGSDGFRAALRYRGTDLLGLLALAAGGNGLSVLPAAVVEGRSGLVGVPVSAPSVVHRIEVLHQRDLDDAAADLVSALLG